MGNPDKLGHDGHRVRYSPGEVRFDEMQVREPVPRATNGDYDGWFEIMEANGALHPDGSLRDPLGHPFRGFSRRKRRRWDKAMVERSERIRESERNGASFTAVDWEIIKAAFNWRCAYCEADPNRLVAEHVIAVVNGGPNDWSNIVPACWLCNGMANGGKGRKDMVAWVHERFGAKAEEVQARVEAGRSRVVELRETASDPKWTRGLEVTSG